MRRVLPCLFTATTVFLATPLAAEFIAPERVIGVASASDSDTLRMREVPFRIRLHGIDAPEAAQTCNAKDGGTWPCGAVATQELRRLVDDKEVECRRAGEGQDH